MKLPKLAPPDPNKPQTGWDKIVMTTPVVLTVIATVLAGLSSSSMNLGQYYRGLAAQYQSKAGDQWNLFQAKKLRQAGIENTMMLMSALSPSPVKEDENSPAAHQAAEALKFEEAKVQNPEVRDALKAIDAHQPESQTMSLVARIKDADLDEAFDLAQRNNVAFDAAVKPANDAFDEMDKRLRSSPISTPEARAAYSSFTVSRLRYQAGRYEKEAHLNMLPGQLYEIQVRQNSALADRHRQRSKWFFFGMLAAQLGVTVSAMAVGLRQRNVMWTFASLAGLGALIFGLYVYAFI